MDKTTQDTPHGVVEARSFGTDLSPNLTPRYPSTKKVKLRKTPRATQPYDLATYEYTVTFLPGPVGVQLEPVSSRNHHNSSHSSSSSSTTANDDFDGSSSFGCRVLKLVDGTRPGQARSSGKICPGDFIVSINGQDVSSAKYHDILELLKQTESVRQVGFRSVWDPKKLFSQQRDQKTKTPGTNVTNMTRKSPPTTAELTKDETDSGPTTKAEDEQQQQFSDLVDTSTSMFHPPSTCASAAKLPMFDIGLIHSPSETVLLSHVLSGFHELANSMVSATSTPPPTNRTSRGYEEMIKSFFRGSTAAAVENGSPTKVRDSVFSPSKVKKLSKSSRKIKHIDDHNNTSVNHGALEQVPCYPDDVGETEVSKSSDLVANEGEVADQPSDDALERVVQAKAQLMQELTLTKKSLDEENLEKQSLQEMLVAFALKKAQLEQQIIDQKESACIEKAVIDGKLEAAVLERNLQSHQFQQLQMDYHNLMAHARRLEHQNNKLQNERNAAPPIDLNAKLQVAELEAELKQALDDKTKSEQSRRQVESQLSAAQEIISNLEASNRAVQEDLSRQSKQLDTTSTTLQQTLTQIASLIEEIGTKDAALAAMKHQQERTEKVLGTAEHKVAALQAENERIEEKVTAANEAIANLQEELTLSRQRDNELSAAVKQYRDNFQALKAGSADLEVELLESRRTTNNLAEQVSILEQDKKKLERDLEMLQVSKSDLENRLASMDVELENRDTRMAANAIDLMAASASAECYQRELRHASNKVEGLTSDIHALQESNQELQIQLDKTQLNAIAAKQKLSEEIASLNEVLAAAQEELECQRQSAEQAASHFEEQLAASKADVSKYRNDLFDLRQKIACMPAISYTKSIKEIEIRAEIEKNELQGKLTQSMTEAEALRQQAANAGSEVQRLTKQCEELQVIVKSNQEELQEMRSFSEVARLAYQNDREKLIDELENAHSQASSLSKSLQSQHRDIDALRRSKMEMNEEYTEKIKQATRELTTLRHDKDVAARNLTRARDEIQSNNEKIKRLEADFRKELVEKMKLIESTEEEKASLQKRLSHLELEHANESKARHREQHEFKSALQLAENHTASCRRKLDELKSELDSANVEVGKANQERIWLKSELDRAEDTISELKAQLRMLEDETEGASSEDSFNDEMEGLTKSELRVKCVYLQEELLDAATRASESSALAAKRATRIQALEADLRALSDETRKLVETNEQLEKKLLEMRELVASSESEVHTNTMKTRSLEAYAHNLKEKFDQLGKKNAALVRKSQLLCNDLNESKGTLRERESELERVRQSLKEAFEKLDAKNVEVAKERENRFKDAEGARLREAAWDKKSIDLAEALKLTRHVATEKSERNEELTRQLLSLEEKCATLQKTVGALEKENNQLSFDLRGSQEANVGLKDELEKCGRQQAALEESRNEGLSRLDQATKDLRTQKEIVSDLEHKSQELHQTICDQTDQIVTLERVIEKMRVDATEKESLRSSELVELQKKSSTLEQERKSTEAELATLQGELRQSTRKLTDLEKHNGALTCRVEELKQAVQATKAQLNEVRQGNTHSTTIFKDIEGNLEAKRSEIERLKAQVQILNATVSRLKSDKVLLQEAVLQAESKAARVEEQIQNGEHFGSQYKNGSAIGFYEFSSSPDNTNDQLQQFLDSLVTLLDDGLKELTTQSLKLERSCKSVVLSLPLRALDLANVGHPSTPLIDMQSCLDAIASLVSKMISQLREKHDDLIICHETYLNVSATAPSPEGKDSHAHHTILDTFRKMKQLVHDQTVSPVITTSRGLANNHYPAEAMQSLELQIESLVIDLKGAKDALRSKGQMINELERIVRQRENECSSLESRLQTMNDEVEELNENLREEVESRTDCERRVIELRQALGEHPVNQFEREAYQKEKAAQLIHNFTEKRSRQAAANAFRQWACATSAMQAVSHQIHIAHALSYQLETTREKLVVLKSHLKHQKNRRMSCHGSRSASRTGSALECLEEEDESFTL